LKFAELQFGCYRFAAFKPSAVWAEGAGLEPNGNLVRQTARFVVHAEKAGDGKLEVKCIGPRKTRARVVCVLCSARAKNALTTCGGKKRPEVLAERKIELLSAVIRGLFY